MHKNKAIVDIRLRPRCAIPPPSLRRIGRIACAQKALEYYLRLSGILNDPFCSEHGGDAAATAAAKIANVFQCPGQCPKIAPSAWGICTPI